jgi:hypothetical protein
MTRVAAILAALALVVLLSNSSATGDTPPAEYHVYLPEAYRAPYVLVPCPCATTATPWPTLIPPAISITRTPTP